MTLTVQADEKLQSALERRAEQQGKTLDEVVRDILGSEVGEHRSLGRRVGYLRGSLELDGATKDPWRGTLHERNWRS